MTTSWGPDRGVRRAVLAVGSGGLTVIGAGLVLDALWLLGCGVWGVIVAFAVEVIYRP
ncbi:hypothetical protein [Streptomyces sp. NPDC057939]|uniref:hypothetical protein n=1 Tax=Streptomyces sp. NPDC057939 TaxID=3346284 RepID=UPI0036EF8E3B